MARHTHTPPEPHVYPSHWLGHPPLRGRGLYATHAVTPDPAPAPALSFAREATAWRRREDEKALDRDMSHAAFFLSVDGGVERQIAGAPAAMRAYLEAAATGVRAVLVHRVWRGAVNWGSKSARIVSETVLQETQEVRS